MEDLKTFVVEWEEIVSKDEFVYARTRTEAEAKIEHMIDNEHTITGIREIETDDDSIEMYYWRD